MTHLTKSMVERIRAGNATPEELLPALRHLAQCADCAKPVPQQGADALRERVGVPAEPTHLDPDEQLFPYVDGRLDAADLEVVESHLELCLSCRAEVADLRRIQRPSRVRWHRWLVAAAVVSALLLMPLLVERDDSQRPPSLPSGSDTVATSTGPPPPEYPHAEWTRMVAQARRTGQLTYPADLATLTPPGGTVRGSNGDRSNAVSPAGVVIDETRPRFSWPAREGATYEVVIFADGREILVSPPVRNTTQWTPRRDLPRGRNYTWQVEVTRGDTMELIPAPPEPSAMFRILPESERREIREGVERFPDDHLLHAVLYARSGMKREAEEALQRARSVTTPRERRREAGAPPG